MRVQRDMHPLGKAFVAPAPPPTSRNKTDTLQQVEAANEAFGPLEEEIEHAQKVLAAWDTALGKGQGTSLTRPRDWWFGSFSMWTCVCKATMRR